mmetsp:Transcript_810/g.1201  ORF Transcript_810/g.1201 Transcript_810/m.1201 type:complete len:273 (-) Transcript_810:1822-2640(-)
MAANFWESTHCKSWLFTEERLRRKRADFRGRFSEQEVSALLSYLSGTMQSTGKRLEWRPQVTATAIVLFRRFFTCVSIDDFDPRLVAPACLYVAGKVEEMGQIKPEKVLKQYEKVTQKQSGGKAELPIFFPEYTTSHVHDYEFHVLKELNCDLVVFHPYRTLLTFVEDASLSKSIIHTCWTVVNDSYLTDLSLLYPPHIIALGAIYVACIYKDVNIRKWYDTMNVNLDEIKSVVRQLMNLYSEFKSPEAEKKRNSSLNVLNDRLLTYIRVGQ